MNDALELQKRLYQPENVFKPDKLEKLEQKFANKSHQFWATMRTNLNLANRSDYVDEITIEHIRNELSDILDSGILNYPQTLKQLSIDPGMPYRDKKVELGLKTDPVIHRPDEKRFLKNLAYKASQAQKSNWSWRIGQEAVEKQEEGWHPFFVTLTIDPQKAEREETTPEEIWKKGREFRKYIRRLVNIVCKELGHPPAHKPPYRPESDYVTYAGVIEHGKTREHHHAHIILWLRRIPASWCNCPNAGIRNPANRTRNECLPLRTEWTWSLPGLSPALYFRSVGDIWSTKYNFVLPLKDGQPMKVSVPRVAGAYITKYLAKEHREWQHRMKATRNLGMNWLKTILRKTDKKIVEALTWRAENSSTNTSLMTIHTLPIGLLRQEAKRVDFLNKFRSRQLDLTSLLQSNIGIFSRMLSSVRNGARPDRMDSSEFFDWVGAHLPAQKEYSSARLIAAHVYMGKWFPPEKRNPLPKKIGANKIGHS